MFFLEIIWSNRTNKFLSDTKKFTKTRKCGREVLLKPSLKYLFIIIARIFKTFLGDGGSQI